MRSPLPLCGVAVSSMRCRSGSAARPETSSKRCVAAFPRCRTGTSVGLVDDHQFRGLIQELVAPSVGLDEVGRHDHERIAVEQGLAERHTSARASMPSR